MLSNERSPRICSDNAYRQQLAALQEIRSIAGGNELDLPQICVVGDQSSGKSALLEALFGMPFPVKSDICTRAPIVVECRLDEALEHDVYEIEKEGRNEKRARLRHDVYEIEKEGRYEKVTRDLAGEISRIQDKAIAEAESGGKISKNEVRVRVRGPRQVNVIVVDLPGIIHNGPGKEETKELIDAYIKKEQTLILLVSEAKQDDEGCAAIGMAAEWDRSAKRTLRVFTKCDTWDSDDNRKRMMKRMCDQEGQDKHLLPHAVICRLKGGISYVADREASALDGMSLPQARAGVGTLRERLPPLFAELIRLNLPLLEQDIAAKIQDAKDRLRSVGEESPSGGFAKGGVFFRAALQVRLRRLAACMGEVRSMQAAPGAGQRDVGGGSNGNSAAR